MLNLEGLKKSYNDRIVLEINNLNLNPGSYWIKGKNGSGKTTLMKIVAGLIPFEGSVKLNSINLINDPVSYRKQISYAEAEPIYPPFLTGKELTKFVQSVHKEENKNVQSLIDMWKLDSFINNRIETYSSGMIKKLSLAIAFIGKTNLILLDEPLITLEDSALPILFNLISERGKEGTSFLFTSHQAFSETDLSLAGKVTIENQTARLE